ncbi:kinesin-like protein Klp61F [Teleopsis dalmanni]|uniref:kinesin-like protein Klp61F n=1 Tax=Teleopsis dalmanni TaxID=139649 RepID=UPI0018CE5505|nr:kinesin-like protein Klp61F [Teleopsis dalmanni]
MHTNNVCNRKLLYRYFYTIRSIAGFAAAAATDAVAVADAAGVAKKISGFFDDSTKKGSVIIQGLEEIPVHSKDDVYKLLEKGKERRKTATTLMNAQSSRSHTVFSILVHIRENGIDGEEMLKIGKLNLVDLAGSENVSKAGNEKGIRVRETVNINQSLLTLGRVITALVERTPHVPYRESKLTRLLQESLGGRTKTSIIATISPGHKDIEETLSTLEYAHRAKNIQNKPEVNQKLTKRTVLKEYTEEIDKLKRDLMAARDKNGIYLAEETYNEMTLKMDSQHRELNEKMLLLKALKDELLNKEKIFNEVSLNLVEKTEELKKTEKHLNLTAGALQVTQKKLHETKKRYKEKKCLLSSHVKTEEKLTNQATEILRAADIATKDTSELHNTIERRKHIDDKIQTACERFTDRMHENFEIMDENLSNLLDKHKSYSQMLMEEFDNNIANVRINLLSEANQKINTLNVLCEKSVKSTDTITEKYTNTINELSGEHKSAVLNMLGELRSKDVELKSQLVNNLSDMQTYTDEQLANIKSAQKSIVDFLELNSNNVKMQAIKLKHQIEIIKQILASNLLNIGKIHTEIVNETSLAAQQQAIVDEMIQKLQSITVQRKTCFSNMSEISTKLEQQCHKTINELEVHANSIEENKEKCCEANAMSQNLFDKQTETSLKCVDKYISKCSILKAQSENYFDQHEKLIKTFESNEVEHNTQTLKLLYEHESEIKQLSEKSKEDMKAASDAIAESLNNNSHNLNRHIIVASEVATSLQDHVNGYANLYKAQITNCAQDVNTFKDSELQVYKSTGATPSKRNFNYPRVLAATSPHNIIVKRFRQENEWSDLDTTATIDEEGSGEENTIESPQKISSCELLLNSTPIEPSESLKTSIISINYSDGNISNQNSSKLLRPSNTPQNKTPMKSPRYSTPISLTENKENVSRESFKKQSK